MLESSDLSDTSSVTTLAWWYQRLAPIFPFVLTALVAVGLSLSLSAVFSDNQVPEQPAERITSPFQLTAVVTPTISLTRTVATATRVLTVTPTLVSITSVALPSETPTSAIEVLDESLSPSETEVLQQIDALRAEMNRMWSAYYLARAANQLVDAEAALHLNDLDEVEQVLITVGISLDHAYERSAEQNKGPISEFRMQVGQVREDLRVRPENMDQQLQRLRQSMLSLVDEETG